MDPSSADPNVAAAAAAVADPSSAAPADASVTTPEQLQKDQLASCWSAAEAADVANDPSFDVFVSLASAAEKSGDAAEVVKALELLLKRFPLCYGYWKKLAEAKAKIASGNGENDLDAAAKALAEASEVFERGLSHVGATPELWLSFATKLISASSSSSSSKTADEEKIRAVFERAVGDSGDAWGAGPLWEAFAAWEAGLSSSEAVAEGEKEAECLAPRRAAAVLFRGACQPIRDAEVLRARLHDLASRHSVGELASSEEEAEAARAAARPAGGEERESEGSDGADEAAARSAWLSTLEGASPEFSRGMQLRARRFPFEQRIRRPYWNSRPLDADQLRAWWSLLDDAEGLLAPMQTQAAAAPRRFCCRC